MDAAEKIIAKLTADKRAEVIAYHESGYTEGRRLGEVARLGFVEQHVRHAALRLLGIHPCDF